MVITPFITVRGPPCSHSKTVGGVEDLLRRYLVLYWEKTRAYMRRFGLKNGTKIAGCFLFLLIFFIYSRYHPKLKISPQKIDKKKGQFQKKLPPNWRFATQLLFS